MPRAPLVYLGPTLPQEEAATLLAAEFRGPARRGDIYQALRDGYREIVLIDGEFHGRPSVWQREIVAALREGVTVHGASSMGALRAAELHALGMIGHGRIFEWYRDGVLDADDEVALIYGPAELGYPSLSEPLVNIRATLEAGVPGIMSQDACDRLIAEAKATYFPERSLAALMRSEVVAAWSVHRRDALTKLIRERRVDQKRLDALAALTAVAVAKSGTPERANDIETAPLWQRERLVAEGLAADGETLDAAAIGRRAGVSAGALARLRRELSALFFVAEWARERGLKATSADIARERLRCGTASEHQWPRAAPLLERRALAVLAARAFDADADATADQERRRKIVLDWAQRNGIARDGLSGDALADWVIDAGPPHFGYHWHFAAELVDALLLDGRGARLRSAKRR